MKQLTYPQVGAELGVHPNHVRRIIKDPRLSPLIQPIVSGYNKITFRRDQVLKVKAARRRAAVESRKHAAKLRTANGGAR